jgi:hypothetical protein
VAIQSGEERCAQASCLQELPRSIKVNKGMEINGFHLRIFQWMLATLWPANAELLP